MLISLIFLSNKLCDPRLQRNMRLPMEFMSFAILEANLFHNPEVKDTFTLPSRWKNTTDVVYGAVFLLKEFDYHVRSMDAYQMCSLSTLRKNHTLDTQHRVTQHVTLISFNTLDELDRLMYRERGQIETQMYIGNPNQSTIARYGKALSRMRIISGVHKEPFLQLTREVL